MAIFIRPEDARQQEKAVRYGICGVTSLSMLRRVHDARYATRYFVGNGLDVGGGIDSLALQREFFPLMRQVFIYDQMHGDGQRLENVADASFDFLYSSHCLEHLRDPVEALNNWIRVVKPRGHLVVQVPDEYLYEQGNWPSMFNSDHKLTFTMGKARSWSPVSVNVLELLFSLRHLAASLSVFRVDHGVRFGLLGKQFDMTQTPMCEAGIEFVLQRHAVDSNLKLSHF